MQFRHAVKENFMKEELLIFLKQELQNEKTLEKVKSIIIDETELNKNKIK